MGEHEQHLDALRRIAQGIAAIPNVHLDADMLQRIADGQQDVPFADLDLDSLAMMELSIWVEVETGQQLSVARLAELGTTGALARLLAPHFKA